MAPGIATKIKGPDTENRHFSQNKNSHGLIFLTKGDALNNPETWEYNLEEPLWKIMRPLNSLPIC